MIRSSLYTYSDACILVKGTMPIPNTGTAVNPNINGKKVIFKNCAPLTDSEAK